MSAAHNPIQERFTKVRRFPHDEERTWLHNSKPVWATFYSAVPGIRTERWTVYRAAEQVPAGRAPWTVDNRRIGEFPTLGAALEAAEQFEAVPA